ncbi:MAG: hypothetical protein FJ135_13315 [Deltaproteobacteria bacterium]|nr:hypothetical protein [Deltaproteobacteria bacterium]
MQEAVRRFVDTYNREWLVDKNGYQSPWQARANWLAKTIKGLPTRLMGRPGRFNFSWIIC